MDIGHDDLSVFRAFSGTRQRSVAVYRSARFLRIDLYVACRRKTGVYCQRRRSAFVFPVLLRVGPGDRLVRVAFFRTDTAVFRMLYAYLHEKEIYEIIVSSQVFRGWRMRFFSHLVRRHLFTGRRDVEQRSCQRYFLVGVRTGRTCILYGAYALV